MVRSFVCSALLICMSAFAADEQLTIHKVTIHAPSGVISGKVVGTGDKLVFVDDNDPSRSFTLARGEVKTYRTGDDGVLVELVRPVADATNTTSNLRITVVEPTGTAALTRWLAMPVERARTVTTYSVDVQHDHKGQGQCKGKLFADDQRLRFESVTEANHSQVWNYNQLQSFDKERDHALLKVTPKGGETWLFNVANGATAGALYNLVSQQIVSARPQ